MPYIPINTQQNLNNTVNSGGYISILGNNELETKNQVDDKSFLDKTKNFLLNVGAKIQEGLGITGETIPERAKQAGVGLVKGVYNLAKDIFLEAPSRATASLLTREPITPTTKLEKFFWGEKEIKPIEQQLKESVKTGEKVGELVGEKVGLTELGKETGKVLAPIIVGGMTLLDLTPFGGSRKKLVDELAKTKNSEEVFKILKKIGVSDDIAKKYTPELVNISKPKEVDSVLQKIVKDEEIASLRFKKDDINNFQEINKLKEVLKEAKQLRGLQEDIYKTERAKKYAKMIEKSKNVAGEEGFFARLAALKGEMKKVDFESIADKFTKNERDNLFNVIWQTNRLNEWEKLNAAEGLSKILGYEGGRVPTMYEIEKLAKVFPEDVIKEILDKRGLDRKTIDFVLQLYNLPRTIMAGFGDLSATFLQNTMFAFRYPLITAKNFVEQVKMFGSENYFKTVMNDLFNRPNFELYKRAGLELTDVGPVLATREETFMSPFIEKVPGIGSIVRATGRAWTGFLNKMRADVFDKIVNDAKILGKDVNDERFLKSLGSLINAATGRGKLGIFERNFSVWGQVLFSARRLAATAQMLNPTFYVKVDPYVRKEALKTWLAFLGSGMTLLGLAKMAGAEVETDPTSADFGKIKIGNTRINVFGQYQQVAVLLARLFAGRIKSSVTERVTELGPGFKNVTRTDIITNFFETKQHPTLSYLIGLIKGTDQIGKEFKWKDELLSRFIPMIFADSYDLYKEYGPFGLLGVIPITLGIPIQTYGKMEMVEGKNFLGEQTVSIRPVERIENVLSRKIFGEGEIKQPSLVEVETFYNQLRKMPRENAREIFNYIAQNNQELAERILDVHMEKSLGITPEERLIKLKEVRNGERAKAILEKLNKLKTNEEKRELWNDYVKKGIITEEVAEQLIKLIKK